MKDQAQRSSNSLRLLALSGPASWLVIYSWAIVVSSRIRGPDSGWYGLGMLAKTFGAIILYHLVYSVMFISIYCICKIRNKRVKNSVLCSLQYAGVILFLSCIFVGPKDLFGIARGTLINMFK